MPVSRVVTARRALSLFAQSLPPAYRLPPSNTYTYSAQPCATTGGVSLREAFEQVGLALFNYMTPIDGLAPDDACTR